MMQKLLVSHERDESARNCGGNDSREKREPITGRADIDLLLNRVNELQKIENGHEAGGQRQSDVAQMKPEKQDETEDEIERDAGETDPRRSKKNDVPDKMAERTPEAGAFRRLEPGRLHRVKAGDENLDPRVAGQADGVGLQGQRRLAGGGGGERSVLVNELDDRLRDDGQADRSGQGQIKTETKRLFDRFAERFQIVERVLPCDRGQGDRGDGHAENSNRQLHQTESVVEPRNRAVAAD